MSALLFAFLVLLGGQSSAQVSSNKVLTVGTNNLLRPPDTNFFTTNIYPLTNALYNAGYGSGGGGGSWSGAIATGVTNTGTQGITNAGPLTNAGEIFALGPVSVTGLQTNFELLQLIVHSVSDILEANGTGGAQLVLDHACNLICSGYAGFASFNDNLGFSTGAGSVTTSNLAASASITAATNITGATVIGTNQGSTSAFSGNAPGLTNLNAASLSSGTVPTAVLASNLQLVATNANIPGWQANTVYLQGNIVSTANLQLWEAFQGGTSGSTAPSGSQEFMDNTLIWFPYGKVYDTFWPVDYPAVTVSYSNAAPAYPGLTNFQAYVPYATGYPFNAYVAAAGLQYFTFESGPPFPIGANFESNAMTLSQPQNVFTGALDATNFSWVAGWNNYERVRFVTSAPMLAIGPIQYQSYSVNGILGNITVDGQVVAEQSYNGLSASVPSFVVLDFHGVRKQREIGAYFTPSGSFPGVLVDRNSTVAAAPTNYTIGVIGCSFECGGNTAPYCAGNLWPQVMGRLLNCGNVLSLSLGGTGFSNFIPPSFSAQYVYPLPASNAVPDNYIGRIPLMASNNPDFLIVSGDWNDLNNSNGTYLSNSLFLTTARSAMPTTPIIEICLPSPGYNNGNASATTQMYGAMTNAVGVFADTNVFFLDLRYIWTGTANVSGTNGTGNADIFCSTDGIHPTDLGAKEIASKVAVYVENLWGSPAQIAQKFYHGALTRPVTSPQFYGAFNGNGAGLTNLNAAKVVGGPATNAVSTPGAGTFGSLFSSGVSPGAGGTNTGQTQGVVWIGATNRFRYHTNIASSAEFVYVCTNSFWLTNSGACFVHSTINGYDATHTVNYLSSEEDYFIRGTNNTAPDLTQNNNLSYFQVGSDVYRTWEAAAGYTYISLQKFGGDVVYWSVDQLVTELGTNSIAMPAYPQP